MGIIRSFLTKYHQLVDGGHVKAVKRKQFNMMVDEGVADGVKLLAIVLEVPKYVVVEHLLQLGTYYMYRAMEDPERRQELQKHLVEVHLLGDELVDDESILRLGE